MNKDNIGAWIYGGLVVIFLGAAVWGLISPPEPSRGVPQEEIYTEIIYDNNTGEVIRYETHTEAYYHL